MGNSLSDLAAYMARFGYAARDLVDAVSPIDIRAIEHVEDVLFLPEEA
jgi:hypothetical protein